MKRVENLALSLPLLVGLPSLTGAQQPAQPSQFIHVITMTARAGAIAEFEAFQRKIKAGAEKVNAPQHWTTSSMMMGGPGRTYTVVLPFNKWSEVDGWTFVPQILVKAYGEAEAGRILRAGGAAMEQSETAVYRLLPNLSTRPRALLPPPAYIQLIVTEVEPSMVTQFEGYLEKVRAAQEKSPQGNTAVRRVALLGASNTYVTAVPFDKFADRDSWQSNVDLLKAAYGEAEAQSLNETRLKSTRNARLMVLAYRPDLSRPATGSPSASR